MIEPRLETDLGLPYPAEEHEHEGHHDGDDHDEVLQMSFEPSARLVLLIVRHVAEQDGDDESGGVDPRDEEQQREHDRGRSALRDGLEAHEAEQRDRDQRDRAEDDEHPVLAELAREERKQQHRDRGAETDDGVGDASHFKGCGRCFGKAQSYRHGIELHPELSERAYDHSGEEDPKGFVFRQHLHAVHKGEIVGRRLFGCFCRFSLGGVRLNARDKGLDFAAGELFPRRFRLRDDSLGGVFLGEEPFLRLVLRAPALRLRFEKLAVLIVELIDALLDLDDEEHAQHAYNDGDCADDPERHIFLVPFNKRTLYRSYDDVHDGGREADHQPYRRHDVRTLLIVGRDDAGHGLIHVVGKGRNRDDGHAGAVSEDDPLRFRLVLRHPHRKHREECKQRKCEKYVRLIFAEPCHLLLHGLSDDGQQEHVDERAGDPDDVAVNGAYLVVLRDLRDGDDQHDRVVDPAVAQRVHPEGQKLFDVEVPSLERLVPHGLYRREKLCHFFFHISLPLRILMPHVSRAARAGTKIVASYFLSTILPACWVTYTPSFTAAAPLTYTCFMPPGVKSGTEGSTLMPS